MSIALPPVDLTGRGIGFTGTIPLGNTGYTAFPGNLDTPAHIALFNDSGAGLQITFKTSGMSDNVPAGAWRTYTMTPGETEIDFQVVYVLPNPPVAQLMSTYYAPNEPVPDIGTLGNSPIGGGVTTSSIQTLSQEGNTSGLLTIDIGDLTFSQLVAIFNNGTLSWSVDQSGVKHQALKIQGAGNPLQLGQVGDVTEALGGLAIDGNLYGTAGTLTVADNIHLTKALTVDLLATLSAALGVTGGTTTDTLHVTGTSALDGDITASGGIQTLQGPATHAGSVSGSANLYQFLYGHMNIGLLTLINYQDAANQDLAFPHGFSNGAFLQSGTIGVAGAGGISILNSGVVQNVSVIATIAAAGGTTAAQAGLFSASFAYSFGAPFNQVRCLASGGVTRNGYVIFIGN